MILYMAAEKKNKKNISIEIASEKDLLLKKCLEMKTAKCKPLLICLTQTDKNIIHTHTHTHEPRQCFGWTSITVHFYGVQRHLM